MSVTEKASCKWQSGEVAKWPKGRSLRHSATPPLRHFRGQSLIEYAVLVAAVTAALIVMSDYVRRAFNAHAEAIEEELNGATE
jgi:Flp pilus assembly pilin Flp